MVKEKIRQKFGNKNNGWLIKKCQSDNYIYYLIRSSMLILVGSFCGRKKQIEKFKNDNDNQLIKECWLTIFIIQLNYE